MWEVDGRGSERAFERVLADLLPLRGEARDEPRAVQAHHDRVSHDGCAVLQVFDVRGEVVRQEARALVSRVLTPLPEESLLTRDTYCDMAVFLVILSPLRR